MMVVLQTTQFYEGLMTYASDIAQTDQLIRGQNGAWDGISAEAVARMRAQNRFQTGLDIARYTAKIMREDMAAYDADPAAYTQSLGCWHGFIAQQKMIAVKKHFGTTKGRYLYLSGWMIAALRSEFGPLPDQSMHEKTSVPAIAARVRPSRRRKRRTAGPAKTDCSAICKYPYSVTALVSPYAAPAHQIL